MKKRVEMMEKLKIDQLDPDEWDSIWEKYKEQKDKEGFTMTSFAEGRLKLDKSCYLIHIPHSCISFIYLFIFFLFRFESEIGKPLQELEETLRNLAIHFQRFG